MSTSTIYIIGGVVLLVIFVLIARLAVRWAIRLTMIGVILIAVVGGAIIWWWTRSLTPKSQPPRIRSTQNRPASTR